MGRCEPNGDPRGDKAQPANGESWEVRLWGFPRQAARRRGPEANGPAETVRRLRPEELFGRAVHFLRLGRGLRLADLAARAQVSLGRLSQIENGKYPAWRGSADGVARALDFADAAALVGEFYGTDYPSPDDPGDAARPP